ncbi:MAG TPA: aminopeptidase [Thermodesulfobacteriota bacterium]
MSDAIREIFTVNLGVKKEERVLVFTDLIQPSESVTDDERKRRSALVDIARDVAQAGSGLCEVEYLEYPAVGSHGKEPPKAMWEAVFGLQAVLELEKKGVLGRILDKKADTEHLKEAEHILERLGRSPQAIIALSNYSTSHTRFRDFLTRVMGVRYASMPLFERDMLCGAMTADWKEVEKRTKRLVEMISGGESVFITSHNGTSITFSIKDRPVLPDTGILTERGSFSNLPAGEAFLAPVEGTAEGVLILEWAPTGRFSRPVEIMVRGGKAVDVAGKDDFAKRLRERIEAEPLCGNIAELGIGTNEKASRPDNILETEKILGTIHIALGDNSSFGGKVSVPFHQDFIFFKPTVEVIKGEEKVEILINGHPKFTEEKVRT